MNTTPNPYIASMLVKKRDTTITPPSHTPHVPVGLSTSGATAPRHQSGYRLGHFIGTWSTTPTPRLNIMVTKPGGGQRHVYTFTAPEGEPISHLDLEKRCRCLIGHLVSGIAPPFTSKDYEYGHYEPYNVPPEKRRVYKSGINLNGVYRHRSGSLYVALDLANQYCKDTDKWPLTVIYVSLDTGLKFVRPVHEFLDPEKYTFVH